SVIRRRLVEREVDEELSFHLAMQARAAQEHGASETDAIRLAHRDFGGVQQARERIRDLWPLGWTSDLADDVRYGTRGLRRTPGFTLAGMTILALGMGANTALFSVISAVLLRPLPYTDADRLVRIWTAPPDRRAQRLGSALPDYRAWRADTQAF